MEMKGEAKLDNNGANKAKRLGAYHVTWTIVGLDTKPIEVVIIILL